MSKKFPTITKGNLDTWNDITYGYIITGIMAQSRSLSYGECMTRANDLTNLLFTALREKMGVRRPDYHKEF